MSKNKTRRKPRFSAAERIAYYIGVGISAERHGDGNHLLDSTNVKIRNSVRAGYNDDNRKDISGKVLKTLK